jgi:hypothetical protein
VIERVHWGKVGPCAWRGQKGTLFGVWPAPLDHDACFAEAGFKDFRDTDDAWEEEFEALLQRLVAAFARCGPTTSKRPAEVLARAARDDRFEPCVVELGAPPRALLSTSDGHPIVWIWLRDDAAEVWGEALGLAGLPTVETALTWQRLLPLRLDQG